MIQKPLFIKKVENVFFYLLILFLPTQLGKHFWPDFAFVNGIRIDYLSPTIYVTDIVIGLLFVLWLMNKVQSYSSKLKILSFSTVILGFLIINIVSSHNIVNGFYHLIKLCEFSFLAYYVASMITTIRQIKQIFFFLGVGVIVESLLAVAQFSNQGSIGGLFYFFGERTFTAMTPGVANASISGELFLRAYGTFSHPNVLAGYLVVSMICLLFSFPWVHKSNEKIFWIFALPIGSNALLLTMSRLAFIVWLSILIIVFLYQMKRKAHKLLATVLLFGVVAVAFIATPFGARLLQTNIGEEAIVQREALIRASGVLILQQPVVGVGLGNFIPKLATVQEPLSSGFYLQPVHNIFLLVLVETGFIGLGFFVWFLVKTYQKLFADIRTNMLALPYRILLIALTVILILGLFDHYFLTLQQGQLLFTLLIGLSWTNLKES